MDKLGWSDGYRYYSALSEMYPCTEGAKLEIRYFRPNAVITDSPERSGGIFGA